MHLVARISFDQSARRDESGNSHWVCLAPRENEKNNGICVWLLVWSCCDIYFAVVDPERNKWWHLTLRYIEQHIRLV